MEALMPRGAQALWQLLRWQSRRHFSLLLRRFGWGGLGVAAGALVLILCAAVALQSWRSAEHQRAQLQMRLATPVTERRVEPVDDAQLVTNYYGALPSAAEMPAILESLLRQAQANGIALGAGEYRMQAGALQRSIGYRIRFPMDGDAAAIQAFVLGALNRHPSLALDSLSMRRETPGAQRVEASVQFVLWISQGGA